MFVCGWWWGITDPFKVALFGTLKVLFGGPFALPPLLHGDVVKVGSGVKGLGKEPGIVEVVSLGDPLQLSLSTMMDCLPGGGNSCILGR